MKNRSTEKCPFEIVYTKTPLLTLDLANIPSTVDFNQKADYMAERIVELHKEVMDHLLQSNANYKGAADVHRRPKEFKEGDLVMIHLRKSRFPKGTHNKLHPRKFGPFRILKCYGDNAYHIELPDDLRIKPIFNVADIFEYVCS